jgi:RNA polymerase sigma-70 factor (ECF subfamily)
MKEFPQRGKKMPASDDVELVMQTPRRLEDPPTVNDMQVWRAQLGNLSAVRDLYLEHHEHIYRFIWSRVHDPSQADDLTGEVFLRMVSALHSYQDRAIPFRAWLFRIARNLVIDWFRENCRHPSVSLEDAAGMLSAGESPEERLEQTMSLEQVLQALERIEPAQREVVELRFLAGLSLKEAALAINTTVAAVKALQHRGLETLKLCLKDVEAGA